MSDKPKKREQLSPDQAFCFDALCEFMGGAHHLPKVYEFESGICINFFGDLSTYDFDKLTRIVLLAHRDAVRIEIASSGPRMIRIIAHSRQHGDRKLMRSFDWHPSLFDLKESIERITNEKLKH